MHEVPGVVDNCSKYEQNQSILFWDITNIKCKKNIARITLFGIEPNAILYKSATHGTWLLYQIWIKINPFSEISRQIHKMYEKFAIITQIWQRATCYFTSMSNTSYLITTYQIWKKSPHSSLSNNHSKCMKKQQSLEIYEEIAIISQIWHRAKIYFMYISSPWYLIMVPNMMEIHPSIHPSIPYGGMFEDGRTDWTLSYIPQFRLGRVGNSNRDDSFQFADWIQYFCVCIS